MKTADMVKCLGWIQRNKESVPQMTRSNVARKIKSEVGVDCSVHVLGELEEECGIVRTRGNAGQDDARKDRLLVVARELVRLMEKMGEEPSTDLIDVCARK